jgi:hypothetical protein
VSAWLVAVLLAATAATAHAVCPAPEASIDGAVRGARELANAVVAYEAHMGELPVSLDALTVMVTNARGSTAGPFLMRDRRSPSSRWYDYAHRGSVFWISGRRLDGEMRLTRQGASYEVTVERFWCGAP